MSGNVAVRWTRDVGLGARLLFSGGRDGWLRAAMTAVGVGLGVALLLVGAAVPTMLQARSERGDRRVASVGAELAKDKDTLLVGSADSEFRGEPIHGLAVQAEGSRPPLPPGVARLPGPGEMVVSPALARLLASREGELLRPRFDRKIIGTIAPEGLIGPADRAVYLGSDRLSADRGPAGRRIDHFGAGGRHEGLDPVLLLLSIIGIVVLLAPIAVFVAAAVRFGGERRDRRLAALRLAGADSAMIRRIAAGEALVGAGLGIGTGLGVFLLARPLIERITLWDISVFAGDVRPAPALAALIIPAVAAVAVAVSVLALRGVVIEPLGVVRRSEPVRRRIWWRLLLPVAGLALLYPLAGGGVRDWNGGTGQIRVIAGAVLLLLGVTALLPWLIGLVVRGLRGGPVSWQLAVRRLQVDSGTSARAVNGVAVAAAGFIALQMMFAGIAADYTKPTGQDPSRATTYMTFSPGGPGRDVVKARFARTAGVRDVVAYDTVEVSPTGASDQLTSLQFGDCAALRALADVPRCKDGDVFVVRDPRADAGALVPHAGQRFRVHGGTVWTVPAKARSVTSHEDPRGFTAHGLFLTPKAWAGKRPVSAETVVYLKVDGSSGPDVYEHVRNTATSIDPVALVSDLQATDQSRKFANVKRGLLIGTVATLTLIGTSLLVGILEQMRERRRLLAVLAAHGTQRAVLTRSVLWQSLLPVFLGLALAAVAGTAFGGALLAMVGRPFRFDWTAVLGISGIGAAVVLLVTALSLPTLVRLTRPEGIRTE
ncbi:ABC transporter permease [Spirillospora sp. NPDC052269]